MDEKFTANGEPKTKQHRWWGAAALILLLASGCAVNQQNDVAIYRKEIDQTKPAPVQIAPDKVVSLTDALMLAVQNQEQLSLQGENYLQALLAKDEAFSNFLPTVNFTTNWLYASAGTGSSSPAHASVVTAGVPGQWNLFNGFRDYFRLRAAKQTIEQQKQLIWDVRQTVLLDVAQTYYQILTSEQSVDVLANSLEAQEANVKILEDQLRVGGARQLDVAQAQAQESATRVGLLQAQADVRTGRAMLAYLVDAPIKGNPLRDDFVAPFPVPPMSQWIAQAEAGRQDLKAADAATRAARYNVEVVFGQYYPTLNLNTNWDLYSLPYQAGTFWSTLLAFNAPLYTGGLVHAEVRAAWSQYRQEALLEIQLRRQIDETVEQAFVALQLAQTSLAELQVEVKAARDSLVLSQELYKNGGGTYLNVVTAQATLLTTQLQLTSEQFAQKTAYFNLLRSAGELSFAAAQSPSRPSDQAITILATQPATQSSSQPGFYH